MNEDITRYYLKKGPLEKKGHIRKNWKTRLFVLTSSEISYIEGDRVKGKIPLEKIESLIETEVDSKLYVIFVKTDEYFNKDFSLACESAAHRKEWVDAIKAAMNNQPIPDSVKPAFAVLHTEDALDDPYSYFDGLMTAFCEAKTDSHIIDVLLRICSFFSRVCYMGLMQDADVVSRCDQMKKVMVLRQDEFKRYGQWTQEVELLYVDLEGCIDYARSIVGSKRFNVESRTSASPLSSSRSNLSESSGERIITNNTSTTTTNNNNNNNNNISSTSSNNNINNSTSSAHASGSNNSSTISNVAVSGASRGTARQGFLENYTMKETLGSGAYSVVYRCEDNLTHKCFAVKCIKKHKLQEADIKSLTTEVAIMGQLDHPNIVRMEAFFDDKEYYFIVTELVDGGELFDKIVEKKCYTENEARSVVKTLVEAIAYCHKRNIAHRDLKPENILIDSATDDIKIADFGFAKNVSNTETGRLDTDCGSPWYVAPEILRGRLYGTEVDMWSLGVIVFILLCGYPPFHDSNQPKLYKKIKNGAFKFESPYWDNVSADAKDLIKRLLVVDPTQRYNTQQVLSHKWFTANAINAIDKPLMSAIRELRTFNTQRRGIIKQGYLTKQGHIIRNWKKRSFVLTSDKLCYFKSETEKKPRGTIPMNDVTVLVDDPNDEMGFVIRTRNGKDYNIHATSKKEKQDWMVLVNSVKRCYIMKQRILVHLAKPNYKDAIEILWEARRGRNMSHDAQLLWLWGRLSHECEHVCGALFMIEAVEERMKDNVSVLASWPGDAREKGRMVAADHQGFVGLFSHDGSQVISMVQISKFCITAISCNRSLSPQDYFAVGSIDGHVYVLSLTDSAVVFSSHEHTKSIVQMDIFNEKSFGAPTMIVAADAEGKIVLWDFGKKKVLAISQQVYGTVLEIRFLHSPDRILMVLNNGHLITLNSSLTQVNLIDSECEPVNAQYATDNRLVIAGKDGVVRVIDCEKKTEIAKIDLGNGVVVKHLDLSRDLDYVLLYTDSLELWRISPHVRKEGSLRMTMPVRALSWSGDFNTLYVSQENHVEKWAVDWILFLEGKKYSPPLSHLDQPMESYLTDSQEPGSPTETPELNSNSNVVKSQTMNPMNTLIEEEES